MNKQKSWRSANIVRAILIVALSAACAVGAYEFVRSQANSGGGGNGSSSSSANSPNSDVPPFTTANVGDCLTWDIGDDGNVSHFSQTDCATDHRFEISARENLATYPSSEFGPKAEAPDLERQSQLREELCTAPTVEYLQGRYDPSGRYTIAPILPPPASWAAGDRTMLCGVQVTNDKGQAALISGKATDQDQARIAQAGQCVAVDADNRTHIVPCEEDHSYEVTSVVDLQNVFPQGTPSTEDQDQHLKTVCTNAALEYIGGDDALYNSTLSPFWTTVTTNSWIGGTHTVNCALFKANRDGKFSALKGSAKGQFTIDGAPPPPQPSRNPLRTPAANPR